MNCRHCHTPLSHTFLDLGNAPPSNAYLTAEKLSAPEMWFPLRVLFCEKCWLVQTEDFTEREALFTEDYGYFSSMSVSWLAHAKAYAETMTDRFGLGASSKVLEVASNDGYLLRNFLADGIPCLGVEPTHACAEASRVLGIETVEEFFGVETAQKLRAQGHASDLTVANNVLAHVPDINDFVGGFAEILKDEGVSTFEFPHFLNLVQKNQFDTVYHEHFSYLSLTAVQAVFETNGLSIFDVEEIPTHGGSLRVYAQRTATGKRPVSVAVTALLATEKEAGMQTMGFYEGFQLRAETVKDDFMAFLIDAKRAGKTVAAYGAAAKGNTLMNFAGVRPDLISFVVDRSPEKAGKYMPGSRMPIVDEASIRQVKPDYVVVLPWNIRDEIAEQIAYIRDWGGCFVVAVPELEIF